jgi:hypothetical protein
MPPRTYCGNNANDLDVVNGTAVIGTRRGCLEKGKSIGNMQPADPRFLREYVPIDDTKVYCGNYEAKPDGYDRFGKLDECFRKGIGVGKRLKALAVLGGAPGAPPPPGPPAGPPPAGPPPGPPAGPHPPGPPAGPHPPGPPAGGFGNGVVRIGIVRMPRYGCGDTAASASPKGAPTGAPKSAPTDILTAAPKSAPTDIPQPPHEQHEEKEMAKQIIKWGLFLFLCVAIFVAKPYFLDDPDPSSGCDSSTSSPSDHTTKPRSVVRYTALFALLFLLFLVIDL